MNKTHYTNLDELAEDLRSRTRKSTIFKRLRQSQDMGGILAFLSISDSAESKAPREKTEEPSRVTKNLQCKACKGTGLDADGNTCLKCFGSGISE